MTLTKNQISELKSVIQSALQMLYDNDISLIERHAHEQSISFRFGLYFHELISNTSFAKDIELTIDAEYNRNGEASKEMQILNLNRRIKPDLIFHRRGYNDKNVLVIEFKGSWNPEERQKDINKLIGFTHPTLNDYQYGLGVFVDLGYDFDGCTFTYFLNGEIE